MANITAGMVKDLRGRTGLGMMDCKKALSEAGGDMDRAIENLRKASRLKAAGKSDRVAAEGVVLVKIAEDGNCGVVVEINSETDFVAKDDNFARFAREALDAAFADPGADAQALLDAGMEEKRQALIQKVGENVSLRRVGRLSFENANEGIVESYVHTNSRIAVLVALKGGDEAIARDVAMHIAAVDPMVIRAEDVPEDVLARESEIYSAQAQASGKPETVVEKMISGRLRKFVSDVTLLEQAFVKDPGTRVGELLGEAGADVVRFLRFEVGEGIEKREVDFAAEVAAQANA